MTNYLKKHYKAGRRNKKNNELETSEHLIAESTKEFQSFYLMKDPQ